MTVRDTVDVKDVDSADVYVDEELVAHLSRQPQDSIRFDYVGAANSATRSVRGQSVSWSLLRSSTHPVITTGGSVPSYFAGLLPEGVRLGVVTASTRTSPDDHLTLLLAVGADTVGNVRVFPSGADRTVPAPLFDPDRDNDFRAVFARLTGSVHADPVGLAGVQPKVSAGVLSTPANTRSGPAILKLTPTNYPLLAENEHFFMTMAAACGLRVASTSLLHDANGQGALLVKRFDRDVEARIPQEDACQVADVYPASKYRLKTETAINHLADACARGGGSRVAAVAELFKVVVFSWLIGNGDLHGKNLSIYERDGIWQPTPAYDLLCTQPYTGWKDPMAMTLFGRANRLTRSHFLDAGERLGLRRRAIGVMLDALVDSAETWPQRCEKIGFGDRQTQLLTETLRERISSVKGG